MGTEVFVGLGLLIAVAVGAVAYVLLSDRNRAPREPKQPKDPKTKESGKGSKHHGHKSKVEPAPLLPANEAILLTISGGASITVDRPLFRIGRASRDQQPPDFDIGPHTGKYGSRSHAEIYLDRATSQWKVRDMGSMNGTFVNERQLRPNEEHALRHRDRISFTDRFEVTYEDPKSGERLPSVTGYDVKELVAKGGMAGVYKAFTPNHDMVAIKVPLEYGEDIKLSTLRLQDEFEIMRRLRSSRAAQPVAFTHCGDGRPAMIMEFLHGQTLRSLLQMAPVSPADAVAIGLSIAEGLAALHALDRIHCDLKPDNVMMRKMVSSAGEIAPNAVLIDFGIAMQNRTTMKNVFGSANYQSPEHILGQQLTLKADIYSLGCMMYEMAANSRLYPEATEVRHIKEFQVNRMPMNVSEQAASQGRQIPQELANLIMLMLEKGPNVRPDLQAVSEQLSRLRGQMGSGNFDRSRA